MLPHLVMSPVFSHHGFKNWTLLFLPEEIICVPHRLGPILEMGLLAGLFLHARAYAVARRELARAREEWSTVNSTRLPKNTWRIPLSAVRRLELRRLQLTASELHIQQAGQREHVFGIFDPWQLGPYAETLRQAHPRIFFEQ